MTSKRWKDLERLAAEALGGERVVTPWQLFKARPDVVAPLPEGRLIVECKQYARHAHHRFLEKCTSLYCDHTGDIPCLITRENGHGEAYASVPLDFFSKLLTAAAGRKGSTAHE